MDKRIERIITCSLCGASANVEKNINHFPTCSLFEPTPEPVCTECKGSGKRYKYTFSTPEGMQFGTCPVCKGTGKAPEGRLLTDKELTKAIGIYPEYLKTSTLKDNYFKVAKAQLAQDQEHEQERVERIFKTLDDYIKTREEQLKESGSSYHAGGVAQLKQFRTFLKKQERIT